MAHQFVRIPTLRLWWQPGSYSESSTFSPISTHPSSCPQCRSSRRSVEEMNHHPQDLPELIGQWTDKMCVQGKVKEQGGSHKEPGKRRTGRTFLSTRRWALECKWRQREVTCTESEVSHKSQKDGDNAAPAQDRHCWPFKSHVNTLELGQGSPAGPKRTPDSSLSPWVSMRTFLWIPSLIPLSVTHTRIQKMSTSSLLDSERTWNMKMLPSGYSTADTQGARVGTKQEVSSKVSINCQEALELIRKAWGCDWGSASRNLFILERRRRHPQNPRRKGQNHPANEHRRHTPRARAGNKVVLTWEKGQKKQKWKG